MAGWAPLTAVLLGASLVGQEAPGGPRPPAAETPAPAPEGAANDSLMAHSALDSARAAQQLAQPGGMFAGGLAFERLGEDWFTRFDVLFRFDWEKVGFGLQLPVRLRVIDNDPQNDGDLLGIVRAEDWDSVADILKVVRYAYIGQRDRRGPYYLRVGLLDDLSLGHGTIVHRYRNDIDVNRWRVGFEASGRVGGVGARGFIGDITDPYLSGLRVNARPLEMLLGKQPLMGFVVGGSLVVDASAPLANCLVRTNPVDPDAPMEGCVSPNTARAGDPNAVWATSIDDRGLPQTASDRAVAIAGIDVGYELVQTSVFSITPYVDLNKITALADGWGLHAGILWEAAVPMIIDTLVLDLRTEYRAVSGDYRGPYVNATYEVERFESLRASATRFGTPTKFAFLCGSDDGDCESSEGRHGFFLELLLGLPEWVFIGGELLDYTGDQGDGTFRLTLEVPALEAVQFTASYFRVGVRDLSDLFAIDDRSAVLARARVPVYSVFAFDFEWARVWRGDPMGGYAPVDDWRVGAGFSVPL